MRKTYILKLALRNITSHRLRSTLTILGIAIGVGFIIFLISLGYGLQRISTQEIANLEALQVLDITPGKSKIIEITDESIDKFKNLSNVVESAPQVSMVGKVSYGTSLTEGVIYGKNVDYLKMEDSQLSAGSLYTDNDEKKVLLNVSMLKQLGENDPTKVVGKKVALKVNLSTEKTGEAEAKVKEDEFVIAGVLKNESSPYVYIPLEQYKTWGVKKYNAAKVKVGDKKYTDVAKKQLENLGYKVTTLKDTVDQINQFFSIFQLILLSFGIIAVIVAALGMFNTLTISLLEKTREISFMKVLGTTSRDIWSLFLGEALLIGSTGAVIGITGGVLTGISINNFLIDLAAKTGNKPVEIFYTPVIFVILVLGVAILVSFLTGVYPSFRASRIDPLESLRYE
jgi:putative ABC transport system permease protein